MGDNQNSTVGWAEPTLRSLRPVGRALAVCVRVIVEPKLAEMEKRARSGTTSGLLRQALRK